ncbi:4-oxalocrotonate tautomerase [Ureibacillus manganicus]|uniref:Tautomerase n=1 Tax=Ureibacillus manganicus DSM 26584 TaxID=1384049 RepID=A0A0A3IYT4_9BACL|nr:4-oxalocrotonate tautomerase [Ureibacillus manganicus]KGR79982.1 4-oxalocrotonate tautomerase [Ureibacillus manganicus DSM 26584]
MPFLHVTIVEGRTEEMKEDLILELTNTVNRVLDAPLENIRVCINEVPASHWGIAGKSIKKRREEDVKR